ncbi:hypothetical protein BDU57DRAFT_15215 [Ampelomyces quisqualis]|uniref:Uncharacterized protein n=1 Tax=Ampelomyces quisqualis TaxID=50730 RepID=A0A6A5R011_AMPQU|nr:hypothetical protein BDU57DRAFT_15215 [Ampelomyces quisqualis]
MPPSHLLTRFWQPYSALPITSGNSARPSPQSARPSSRVDVVSEDWFSRPLSPDFTQTPTPTSSRPFSSDAKEPPDLFATLLFDRRNAYNQTARSPAPEVVVSRRTSTPLTIAHTHNCSEDVSSVTRKSRKYDRGPAFTACRSFSRSLSEKSDSPNTGMPRSSHPKSKQAPRRASKRIARLPEKITAKKKMMTDVTSKKRPGHDDEDLHQRPSKAAKVEAKANIGRKVGASGSNAIIIDTSRLEVIEIPDTEDERPVIELSDLEDEKPFLRNEEQSGDLPQQPNTHTSRIIKFQLNFPLPATDEHNEKIDTVADFTPDLIGCENDSTKATEELERLRQELLSEREKTKKLQQKLEKKDAAIDENPKVGSEREQSLERELQDERQKVCIATQQCEQLREQLRRCQEDLAKQERSGTEHQAQLTENQRQKSALELENDCLRDTIRRSNLEAKDFQTQISNLKDDKSRLAAELVSLKSAAAASPVRALPTLSPVPSLCSSSTTAGTEEDVKTENVRKTYIKVKRQLENLQAAASNLATCTQSMDLTSFGDFGREMKKLRNALEIDRSPRDSQGNGFSVFGKADDKDDLVNQRSRG